MKLFITLLILFGFLYSSAQAPFTTYIRPKANTQEQLKAQRGVAAPLPSKREVYQENRKKIDSLTRADYFDHISANIVVIQDANKFFPTINGEVINYRLGIWTEKKVKKENRGTTRTEKRAAKDSATEPRVHYLPFSIITKVSANYLDSSAGPINDATSFFGAPLTFRFAPACDLTPENDQNKLFLGMNTDLRLLVLGNDDENSIDAGWGTYVSGGFTYMGLGHAYETNPESREETRHNGKWSFSTMLYWFKSGGKFNKAVFNSYETKSISGIEMMLRFKASKKEDSKFNFLVSASNGFTKDAPNFAKWQFTIGVGR